MDSFTENILARARQRQKLLSGSSSDTSPKSEHHSTLTYDEPIKKAKTSLESYSDPVPVDSQAKPGNNLQKFVRQNSKTRVSSDIPGSPQPQKQTLNIQRDNFNMEIKLTSTDNLRVEVEIEEQNSDDSIEGGDLGSSPKIVQNTMKETADETKSSLRQDAKSRLKQLGKLYADFDEDEWEKPKMNSVEKAALPANGSRRVQTPKSPSVTAKTVSPTKNALKMETPSTETSPVKKVITKMLADAEHASDATKQLKWDKKVLDKLESQGFKRTPSNSRIEYSYAEKGNNKNENQPPLSPIKSSPIKSSPIKSSPVKSTPVKKVTISDRTAFFESNSPSNKQKDPALLSVSERKALFERNKGAAILPKAAFGMAAPIQKPALDNQKNAKCQSAKIESKPKEQKEHFSKEIDFKGNLKAENSPIALPKGNAVANTVAALMAKKSTISEKQIEENVKKEREKEMELLLNRFHRKAPSEKVTEEPMEEEQSDEDNCQVPEEATTPVNNGHNKKTPSPSKSSSPEKRRSSEKRFCQADSPKVAAALEGVKRIKVSPPKQGKLYPNLSDIEATTETETESRNSIENSSFEYCQSDDIGNTSFSRDILQAMHKNHMLSDSLKNYEVSSASDLSSLLNDTDESQSDESPEQIPFLVHAQQSETENTPNTPSSSAMSSSSNPQLIHTISFYRKQQTQMGKSPMKQVLHQGDKLMEEAGADVDYEKIQQRIHELEKEVNRQQMTISQTSQALNLCNSTPEFSGSTEQVEAERVLLVASHKRLALLDELQRLRVERTLQPKSHNADHLPLEKGTLTITDIVLPMKETYMKALTAAGGKGHHVVCLIKCGEQVIPTKLVSTVANNKKFVDHDLIIPGAYKLHNVYNNNTVRFEVYCLQAQEEFLPHEVKYHINSKKHNSILTPKKNKNSRLIGPIKESPGGPQAVRSSSFALMGYVVFAVNAIVKRTWALNNTPSMSPLEGSVDMKISYELSVNIEHRGFLTMFEDVSGFGAWHRRWCLLKGHYISYWKYPDDERKMAPIDSIDLRNCITKNVGPVSKDICARMHTFLLERERAAEPGDRDTLVMCCKGEKTIIRHLFSADTKEERIEWTNKLNSTLSALRTWKK